MQAQTPIGLPLSWLGFDAPANAAIKQTADLEYMPLTIDGIPTDIVLTAELTDTAAGGIRRVERRARSVQADIETLLSQGFDPESFQVSVGQLNNQPVLTASDSVGLNSRVLLTVTTLDARWARQSQEALASAWRDELEQTIVAAYEARQPEARRRRQKIAIGTGLITLGLGFGFYKLNKAVDRKEQHLRSHPACSIPRQDEESALRHESPRQRKKFYRLIGNIVTIAEAAIWLGGSILILAQFSATREISGWLLGFPLQLAIIILVTRLVNRIADIFIDRSLEAWGEQQALTTAASKRVSQRLPTLSAALSGLTRLVTGTIGLGIFLSFQPFSIGSVIAGAGIFGAALAVVFQNLIKDFITGILILWEDQFAVGDVIDVGVAFGFVEVVGLRVTKIRGDGGRLSVIPNSQIAYVHNMTNEWSRADFRIRVDRDTDPAEAMALMREVSVALQADPDWHERIFDPVMLIGVERLDERGVEILQWIQTAPLSQWDVEREYRRRLKQAFERAGIEIAIPAMELRGTPHVVSPNSISDAVPNSTQNSMSNSMPNSMPNSTDSKHSDPQTL